MTPEKEGNQAAENEEISTREESSNQSGNNNSSIKNSFFSHFKNKLKLPESESLKNKMLG